ncbi:VVA0879 family protein [Streptomyces nigra]|uniref:VVA0879 family protein n=1 Tax=Streptomyces nigra TaxID=1827580 RepID=UPI003451F515
MTNHRRLTQAELVTEATERFGNDPMKWAFLCPTCGDTATGADFREALAARPRKHPNGSDVAASDVLGQECIGRTLGALDKRQTYSGRGCDWAAYGLFGGPWTVDLPDGHTIHSFPLAPAS